MCRIAPARRGIVSVYAGRVALPTGTVSLPDPRLARLFGDGATAFRAAFDLVPDPVGVLWAIRDRSGAIADFVTGYSNPAMARMIGVPIEASMGRRLLAEAPDFAQDETFARMRGVLESGRPEVVEVAVASGDGPIGRVRGVFLHRAIPFGADGVLNLVTDVTEQRRMEDELRDYAKVAAHDLREPIMAAGYFIELLDRRLSDGRTQENEELLERVRQTHARARSLVDGMLEYARSGTSLAAEAVDTGALMADVAASLANAVERAPRAARDRGAPVVRGDRAQLGRVFQNLVANGLKFHADEPPRVAVSAERHEAAWLFSVRDNGVGVPPELGDEIFSMFKRAHGEEVGGAASASPSAARSSRRTAARSGPSPQTAPAPSCASRCPPLAIGSRHGRSWKTSSSVCWSAPGTSSRCRAARPTSLTRPGCAGSLEAGLLNASFVPPKPIRELRNLTRYRKTQIQERSREVNRLLRRALEDAGIKLDCVAADVMGKSGRDMLDALVAGETDPDVLARARAPADAQEDPGAREALAGHFDAHHRLWIGAILATSTSSTPTSRGSRTPSRSTCALSLPAVELLCTVVGIQRRGGAVRAGPRSAPT